MASATVTPDASVGAGGAASSSAVSSTPSAGGAGAATGSETALLTDDQILGIEQGGNESSTAAAITAETTTAAPAAPEVLSIDDFKALFPNNPKVQSLWDKYSSSQALVGKFGTAAEAHKIADTVRMLGGPEKLASIAQTVADIDQTDARFFNGSPEDRKSLVSEWYEGEGPQDLAVTSKAVHGMVEAALDVMAQRDQNGFLSLRDDLAVQCLRSAPSFQKLLADAAQSQDPAAKAFVQWAQHFGMDAGQNGRQLSPEAQRLAKERESFGKERTDFFQSQISQRVSAADTKVQSGLKDKISTSLKELKIGDRSVFGANSGRIQGIIADRILSSVNEKLMSNPVFLAQVQSAKARGMNVGEQELIDLTNRFIELVLPETISQEMSEWTKGIQEQQNGAAHRARAAATRVDVGSGASSGSGGRRPGLTREKASQMSDMEILNS